MATIVRKGALQRSILWYARWPDMSIKVQVLNKWGQSGGRSSKANGPTSVHVP